MRTYQHPAYPTKVSEPIVVCEQVPCIEKGGRLSDPLLKIAFIVVIVAVVISASKPREHAGSSYLNQLSRSGPPPLRVPPGLFSRRDARASPSQLRLSSLNARLIPSKSPPPASIHPTHNRACRMTSTTRVALLMCTVGPSR